MKRFILILVTTVHTTFFTILQKLFILRFIVTLLLVCPLYIRAPSFILNFPLARQNFTIALLPFLFLSATGFKNFPSVSRTSIRYCSSSTACVYFFSCTKYTYSQWNDNEENKNETIYFDFSHNSTYYFLHYTTKTVYSTFYCYAFAGLPSHLQHMYFVFIPKRLNH